MSDFIPTNYTLMALDEFQRLGFVDQERIKAAVIAHAKDSFEPEVLIEHHAWGESKTCTLTLLLVSESGSLEIVPAMDAGNPLYPVLYHCYTHNVISNEWALMHPVEISEPEPEG